MFEDSKSERFEKLLVVSNDESKKGRWVEGLTNWMSELESSGYKLFSMSITYKTSGDFDHNPRFLSQTFKDLYWHHLLPESIFKNRKWLKKHKSDQPILLLFYEEHQEKGVKTYNPMKVGGFEYVFPERLHHHAILAIRPEHESEMMSLCCENSLRQFSPWVLTSNIKPADLGWVAYAVKDLKLSSDNYEVYGPEGLMSAAIKQNTKH